MPTRGSLCVFSRNVSRVCHKSSLQPGAIVMCDIDSQRYVRTLSRRYTAFMWFIPCTLMERGTSALGDELCTSYTKTFTDGTGDSCCMVVGGRLARVDIRTHDPMWQSFYCMTLGSPGMDGKCFSCTHLRASIERLCPASEQAERSASFVSDILIDSYLYWSSWPMGCRGTIVMFIPDWRRDAAGERAQLPAAAEPTATAA